MPPYSPSPMQDLVTGLELERAGDRVQRRARVRDEDEVRRCRADVRRRGAGGPSSSSSRQPPFECEELDGLPFELALQPLVVSKTGRGQAPNEPWFRNTTSRIEQELALSHS